MISRLWVRICEYLKLTNKRFWNHLLDFWVVWVLLFVILVFSWAVHWVPWVKYVVYISAVLFVVYMLYKPMATVYGLIGGSANIRTFLFNFFLITFLFSFVYYNLFFKDAGVCFDGNNPILCYSIFEGEKNVNERALLDTTHLMVVEERITDSARVCEQVIQTKVDTLCYHRVSYWLVLKNSFLTSLTQSPSDFFFQVSDFGENMNTITFDNERTSIFSIILLLHVLISWLFLGVFISLLYSKFRYEA